MPWNDRIREAAYNSPSGARLTFAFENVKNSVEKKGTAFEFPDADGTYIQEHGHAGRKYPIRAIFWGAEYDTEADAFEAALIESGTGKLEHPVYGTVDVVPFGAITRRDDLKTEANQAVVDVTFWETIGLIYPAQQDDPASAVTDAVDEHTAAAAQEFAESTTLDSAVNAAKAKDQNKSLLDRAASGLKDIAATQADVQKQFDAVVDSIDNGIDILIAQPLTLAFQTAIMIQAPSRALANIAARLDAYRDLASDIISGESSVVTPSLDDGANNEFRTNDLYASAYVTGSILSVVNNQFATKTDALAAADAVLAQMDEVTVWRDDNFQALADSGEVDTGGAYQQLQEAVALTAGFLVEISFSLLQEKRITLDRPRSIIDLVAELYGSIDDQLDFFISSNDLSGSEILELPKGREIAYYV